MGHGHDHFFLRPKFHGKFATFCAKTFVLENARNFAENLRYVFFLRTLTRCVLGLERVCPRKLGPWPPIFFCFRGLGLKPRVLDSTSALCYRALLGNLDINYRHTENLKVFTGKRKTACIFDCFVGSDSISLVIAKLNTCTTSS